MDNEWHLLLSEVGIHEKQDELLLKGEVSACKPRLQLFSELHRGRNTLVTASHFCNVLGIVDGKAGSSSIQSHLLETEHHAYVQKQ